MWLLNIRARSSSVLSLRWWSFQCRTVCRIDLRALEQKESKREKQSRAYPRRTKSPTPRIERCFTRAKPPIRTQGRVNDSLRDKLTELARLVNRRPPDGEHNSATEHSCARGLRLRRCVVPVRTRCCRRDARSYRARSSMVRASGS